METQSCFQVLGNYNSGKYSQTEVVDAILYARRNDKKETGPFLLKMLNDHQIEWRVLHEVVICLGKLQVEEALPRIIELIVQPHNYNCRGTLVWILLKFDCEKYIYIVAYVLCTGSYESVQMASLVLMKYLPIIDDTDKDNIRRLLLKFKDIFISMDDQLNDDLSNLSFINYILTEME